MIITAIDKEEEEEDYSCPDPSEPSTLLFKIEYVDPETKEFGIEEIYSEGGAASYEDSYGCGTADVIKEWLSHDQVEQDMWYVIEGFTTSFSEDYYGETDAWHEYKIFRPAQEADFIYLIGENYHESI